MSVPREVLRWLQSLDLPCIKNPSRDFANGYVVAEILSKQYPGEISISSFDNGMGVAARTDNWSQISEFVTKKGLINLEADTINDIIYYRRDACIGFIVELYSSLTKKSVEVPRATSLVHTPRSVPGYARATASFKLKDSELNRSVDDLERKVKAAGAVLMHELDNKALRAKQEPNLSKSLPDKREFKPVTPLPPNKDIEVKLITVRAYGNGDYEEKRHDTPTDDDRSALYISIINTNDISSPIYLEAVGNLCGEISQDKLQFDLIILRCIRGIRDVNKLAHVCGEIKSSVGASEERDNLLVRLKIVSDHL